MSSDSVINKWQSFFPLDNKINNTVLLNNLDKIENFEDFNERYFIDNLRSTKKDNLTESKAIDLLDHIHARHFNNGEIHVYNLLNEELILNNVFVEGNQYKFFKKRTLPPHNNDYSPLIIETDLKGRFDSLIEIETEILNSKRRFKIAYTLLKDSIKNPFDKITKIEKINFLVKTKDNSYTVKKGKWEINEPLVIKGDLNIEEGTKLIFNKDSYLIIFGRLNIDGSEKDNVVLTSSQGNWKGIYVINSSEKSLIRNTTISNLTNLNDGLLDLTGAVTFYKSDVEIINTQFENSNAEDFLNIVDSNFLLDNVSIKRTISDGLDSDFSSGIIKNSRFENINGDGIDFSGSKVKVLNSYFNDIKDKAVSVGEGTNLEISSIYLNNVGVGLASKDGSKVLIDNSIFSNISLNSLMTYQKKSFYKKSELIGLNLRFDDDSKCCLRQTGSKMEVNKMIINERRINIDSLYQNEIMKK